MKKTAILVFLVLLSVQVGNASWFTLGVNGGYRYLDDPLLGEIYGDGYVFEPYIRYSLGSINLELAYEGGYKRSGPVGFFQEDSTLMSAEDSEKKADFILTATPTIWKRLIRKEEGFISSFMTGKITLAKGEAPKIIALASKSPALVQVFNDIDTEWPDEMSPERLEEYRGQVSEFRQRLGV